ncbi:MAG TPA: lipopolysaccharide heptosyltransferase I [Ramlibacter sp.]|uniref:lipopolysaccharide heptosyltransferase I n=1 Tax=Ramlibacter sp. TaxID=1917967 RepID=UPI002D542235|nr:lipopolysaccharide heptosyltransferase I [Ramlibacter sp.]HZY20184.1 lipopolysaccharide heptosyltransferase I [Ramlibacter sp.]
MNILIVKLSSLGDVVHAMPAVQDLLGALPGARADWVVERGFASLVQRCAGVGRVIPCELRRWRRSPLARDTRAAWRAFRQDLQATDYDAVLDLQGLTKSALVARVARLAPGGRRYALANRTEGSSYEAPTRWVADVAVPVTPRSHAVDRSRELCARALGYAVPARLHYGLRASATAADPDRPCVAFVHGSSRQDKCWPQARWIELGRRLTGEGFAIGLPHGSEAEEQAARAIAAEVGPRAQVWPRLDLGALTDRLAGCAGVVGVDSGLSHIAVALDLPHVQIYNFDTAWRTGPAGGRQRSVFAAPTPSFDAVWAAWQAVREAA